MSIGTKTRSVHRFSEPISLTLAASLETIHKCTRDIIQVHIQSEMPLERDVYISGQVQMQLTPDTVLKVVCPSYGILQSGLNWYPSHFNYHVDHINMFQATIDLCMHIQRVETHHSGLDIIQAEQSRAVGTYRSCQSNNFPPQSKTTNGGSFSPPLRLRILESWGRSASNSGRKVFE